MGACWASVHLIFPRNRSHLRPVAAYVLANVEPSDTIYTFDLTTLLCYWPSEDPRIRDYLDRADQIPTRRFWIVWSGSGEASRKDRSDAELGMREFCVVKKQMFVEGGSAVLFERIDAKPPAKLPIRRIVGPLDAPSQPHHEPLARTGRE